MSPSGDLPRGRDGPARCTRLITQITANAKVAATGRVPHLEPQAASQVELTLAFGSVSNRQQSDGQLFAIFGPQQRGQLESAADDANEYLTDNPAM